GGLLGSPNIPPHYTTNTPNNIQIDNAINPQFNQDIEIFLACNRIEFELQAELHTNAAEISKNFFLSLNIVTHNINGCGTEETFYKLDSLLSYMKSNNIDILTLTETNLDPFKGEALARNIDDHNFHIIFGNKQADKIKGSDTAIIISQKWFHHLYEIWAVYAAPQNKQSILSEVSTLIRNDICNQKNLNQQILHLVTGDFNETLDPVMDRFSVSSHANDSNNSNNSTFFSELIRLRFSDSLQNISSTDRQYTYRHTNKNTLSRIDYIWVSDIQDVICRKYESVDITDITHSDHNLVLTELYLGDFLSINRRRTHINTHIQLEDQYYSQMIIEKDKITNEIWINFQHCTQSVFETNNFERIIDEARSLFLAVDLRSQDNDIQPNVREKLRSTIDNLWDDIQWASKQTHQNFLNLLIVLIKSV
ncbi:hypothetical protein RclHR1_31030001, partial [Rhizophagus clarus]